MGSIRSVILILLAYLGVQLIGCRTEELEEIPDADEQYAEDVLVINSYLEENGWADIADSTESGLRYVALDTGDGPSIEYRDLVTLDFTGRYTDGQAYLSSLQSVVDEDTTDNDLLAFASSRLVFTHSAGGWALDQEYSIEPGFREGITILLDTINVGGSGFAISPRRLTGSSEVVIFEIFPFSVRK